MCIIRMQYVFLSAISVYTCFFFSVAVVVGFEHYIRLFSSSFSSYNLVHIGSNT